MNSFTFVQTRSWSLPWPVKMLLPMAVIQCGRKSYASSTAGGRKASWWLKASPELAASITVLLLSLVEPSPNPSVSLSSSSSCFWQQQQKVEE